MPTVRNGERVPLSCDVNGVCYRSTLEKFSEYNLKSCRITGIVFERLNKGICGGSGPPWPRVHSLGLSSARLIAPPGSGSKLASPYDIFVRRQAPLLRLASVARSNRLSISYPCAFTVLLPNNCPITLTACHRPTLPVVKGYKV